MEATFRYVESIDSTNEYLKKHWAEFGPFAFLRAGFQSAGKGRGDHSWEAKKDENLLFSLLIKEPSVLEHVDMLVLRSALIVAKAIEGLGIEGVSIKWPNDIYVRDKKVCGILLEGRLPSFVVIGIGVNVNQTAFASYRTKATSLRNEVGENIDIDAFYAALTQGLLKAFETSENTKTLLEEFRKRDHLFLKRVSRRVGDHVVKGIAKGVDDSFSLLLEENGVITPVCSGEIKLE